MKNKDKGLAFAISIIMGTIIGAGIIGLPYAISVAGFIPGVIILIIVAFCMCLLMLYLAEVALRCHRVYQLPGLIAHYLGSKYKIITLILFWIGIYGAITSYIIGVSDTLNHLFGGNLLLYKLGFTALLSIPILLGLQAIKRFQFIFTITLTLLILIIGVLILPGIKLNNLSVINYPSFFYPFGVIFFALIGYSVMPELEQVMNNNKVRIDDAIITSIILSSGLYIFFSFAFIGVFGQGVKQVATESLSGWLGLIGNGVAIFGMITSFLGLGMALRDSFIHDLRFNKYISWALTISIPLLTASLFELEFIQPILITGAFTGTLTGFLILLTINKARKTKGDKPAFITPYGKPGIIIVGVFLLAGLLFTILELAGII